MVHAAIIACLCVGPPLSWMLTKSNPLVNRMLLMYIHFNFSSTLCIHCDSYCTVKWFINYIYAYVF